MRIAKNSRGRNKSTHNLNHSFRRLALEPLETRRLLSVDVLTWHNDLTRDGLNSNEVSLTPANVNSSSFGELLNYPVTGQVYGQPLYVSNLAIPGKGTLNVVFVTTENNDVYAFNADSNAGASGGLLWHVNWDWRRRRRITTSPTDTGRTTTSIPRSALPARRSLTSAPTRCTSTHSPTTWPDRTSIRTTSTH